MYEQGDFSHEPDNSPTRSLPEFAEPLGAEIGPYKLLQVIGEGGMGMVYMAEQTTPVRRQVALKIIKPGMDSRQVIARFEAERQALSMMDHMNIAHVLDVGTTNHGRPYFVMELIRGIPITAYCDKKNLSIEKRLALFEDVCRGVQHAHHKGIIHRDLKPSNILVADYDQVPVPKIIDFGLAKALHQKLTEKTMFTQLGQVVGTLEYMSPEQSEMNQLEVDTRTDVYSLGVLLYELLTGTVPFDRKRLRSGALDQVLKIIREEDPLKPSLRLSTVESSVEIAAHRGVEPKRLGTILRGDLDWIVIKALEKDRERRYETVNGLRMDIERFSRGEPVVAAPPTAGYRLRKFVNRNRSAVLAGAMIAAAMVVAVVGTSTGMWWAMVERERANEAASRALAAAQAESAARLLAEENAQKAISAEQQASARARELEQVTQFQADRLSSIDVPWMGSQLRTDLMDKMTEKAQRSPMSREQIDQLVREFGETIDGVDFTGLALETLDQNIFRRAVESIDKQFEDQPVVKARLLQTIASASRKLGLFDLARSAQAEALDLRSTHLGEHCIPTYESHYESGMLAHDLRQYDSALEHLQTAIDGQRQLLGDMDPATLRSIHWCGNVLSHLSRFAEANACLLESRRGRTKVLGNEHPDTLEAIHDTGLLRKLQGNFDEAEKLYRESIEGYRRVLGSDHPDTLICLNNMAALLNRMGRIEEAITYCRETLAGRKRVLGNDHPATIGTQTLLATMLYQQQQFAEAEQIFRDAIDSQRRVYGVDHQTTRYSVGWLRAILLAQEKHKDAIPFLEEELRLIAVEQGDSSIETLFAGSRLADAHANAGDFSAATAELRRLVNETTDQTGEHNAFRIHCLTQLGWTLLETDQVDEAAHVLKQAVDQIEQMESTPDWWKPYALAVALSRLGQVHLRMEEFEDAERLLKRGYEGLREHESELKTASQRQLLERALKSLVELYQAWESADPERDFSVEIETWQRLLKDD